MIVCYIENSNNLCMYVYPVLYRYLSHPCVSDIHYAVFNSRSICIPSCCIASNSTSYYIPSSVSTKLLLMMIYSYYNFVVVDVVDFTPTGSIHEDNEKYHNTEQLPQHYREQMQRCGGVCLVAGTK